MPEEERDLVRGRRGRAAPFDLKGRVAGKAVLLLERAQVPKLREANRNTSADGLGRFEDRALRDEEELLAAAGGPGGDVRAVEVDGGGGFLFRKSFFFYFE